MSRGPENTFIASVHKHLPEHLYRCKMHNEYNSGMADCWYSGADRDLWIEYKFIAMPKRASTPIDPFKEVTPLQRDWLEKRKLERRDVWVIVGCADGGVAFKTVAPWNNTGPWTLAQWMRCVKSRKILAEQITRHCLG